MNNFVAVSLMARIAAIQAEMQGMIAANEARRNNGDALAYDADVFFYISNQLNALSDEAIQAGHNT